MARLYLQAHAHNERNILGLLSPNPKAKLLDLGCDDGQWSLRLGQNLQTNKVYGVEMARHRLAVATAAGVDATFGDLNQSWPFANESFDVVHSSFVIEHVNDIDHFVAEAFRILKPGGYLVTSTENGSSWHNIFAAILGWQTFSLSCCSIKVKGLGNPLALHRGEADVQVGHTHKVIFNYRGFKEIFEVHGFKNVELAGAGYYPLPSWFGAMDPRHSHFITAKAYKT